MKYLWLVLLVGVLGCDGPYKAQIEQQGFDAAHKAASIELENRRLDLEQNRLDKQYNLCLEFLKNQLQNKMPVNCSLGVPR